MLKDNQYDKQFVNQTRIIFNAANKVEIGEEEKYYNSDDELTESDMKQFHKYKNSFPTGCCSYNDFDKEKALKCGFFLDEVNYDISYNSNLV